MIAMRVINGSTYHRPTKIRKFCADFSKLKTNDYYKITKPILDWWYNFIFVKHVIAFCIWGYKLTNLLFDFKFDAQYMEFVHNRMTMDPCLCRL